MNFLFCDHKNFLPKYNQITSAMEDFQCFNDLIGLLDLKYVHGAKEFIKMKGGVAFVHAGGKFSTTSKQSWEQTASETDKRWIIFVSKDAPFSLSSNVAGVKCITQDLSIVVSRLRRINGLRESFLDSCKSQTGPDVKLLMGKWPERVLARYLLDKLTFSIDPDIVQLIQIDDINIINEYNMYAQQLGLDKKDSFSIDDLNNILKKIGQ